MDACDQSGLDLAGECAHLLQQVNGDSVTREATSVVVPWRRCKATAPRGLGGDGEAPAATAVHMGVDKARNHRGGPEIPVGRTWRRPPPPR